MKKSSRRIMASLEPWVVVMVLVLVLGGSGSRLVVVDGLLSCGRVYACLTPCIPYLRTGDPMPESGGQCCAGLDELVGLATTDEDKQEACVCIFPQMSSFGNPLPASVKTLSSLCNITVGFPLDPSTDCSQIP